MIQVPFAIIGGSSTFSINFPDDLNDDSLEVISKDKVYETPFGDSPPLTVFRITTEGAAKDVVTCRMHGWTADRSRRDASKQMFWVFREMGVTKIIAEGGVGAINRDMKPGDIFIPDDYMDQSMRKDVNISNDYLLIMRDPVCPSLREVVLSNIDGTRAPIHKEGVYAVTDGRHFESKAEVRALGILGADAIGQSFAPEVYLAREIGACYLGVYLVVNLAEGIVPEWDYEMFKDLFFKESGNIARILLGTIKSLDASREDECSCRELRVNTLLKK